MSKPRTILLIPTDPALLGGGPCGYRPPLMGALPGRAGWVPTEFADRVRWVQEAGGRVALVLAQDGLVLHPGCFAAVPYGEHGMGVVDLLDAVRDCLRGYTVVWPAGMEGEIVLLDADGQVMT